MYNEHGVIGEEQVRIQDNIRECKNRKYQGEPNGP
jgi:hypothetical protein